ncbi:MAG TPA: dihydropteroate synthase [Pseudogracilibacillus sp.]|nr:dihydropteroate synthase [Pseudogracilibacillus sp.]
MDVETKSKTLHLQERTHIMGILNITPDSFSDGGNYDSIDKAVKQARKMEEDGADIIDVGGESTRPDHDPVSVEEEINRVVPVIEALKREISIPISIDTYKAKTAKQALDAGAEIINDVWGAKKDPEMANVAAEYEAPIILMHNRMNKLYENIIEEMIEDLQESVDIVKAAGVEDKQIIIDPGIGFAKELEDNFFVMKHLDKITTHFSYPLLLATSRKSFIRTILDIPARERDNATGATTCLGIMKGARIVRVHDVKRHVELAKMTDAMVKGVGLNR